jgi:pimeloyl-ACP methyl ester carboxylesterase
MPTHNTKQAYGAAIFGASMLAIAMLFASAAHSQTADTGCQQAAASNAAGVTTSRLADLSYRCMKLVDGSRVWVGVANETAARTVLLVHGMGANAHLDWRSVVPTLLPHFRIVAVDLPGFGASPASQKGYSFAGISGALAEVLSQLKVSHAHVVGHSLGGAVSLHFAHAHPDRVDRLVLVDAAGILHRSILVRYLARMEIPKTGIEALDALASMVDRDVVDQVMLEVLRGIDTREDFSSWIKSNPAIGDALFGSHTQVDALTGLLEYDFTTAIRATNTPTTLIWGRNDLLAPLRTGELLAARMPNARIHVFDGVAHMPMMEKTTQFNALLLDTLRKDLSPKFAVLPAGTKQDVVECNNLNGVRYTGHIVTLKIKNCSNVSIEYAQIGTVTIESSSVSIRYSSIANSTTALTAVGSRVQATAIDIKGAVAVMADRSELDFAGVTLTATQRAADIRNGSRIYFSVSDVTSPTFSANVHAIWTTAP